MFVWFTTYFVPKICLQIVTDVLASDNSDTSN